MKTIGSRAFFGCSNLKTITIPSSVSEIGGEAFDNTAWLEKQSKECIVVNHILVHVNSSKKSLTVPSNVQIIGK